MTRWTVLDIRSGIHREEEGGPAGHGRDCVAAHARANHRRVGFAYRFHASACRPHVSACRLRAIPCRGDQTAVHADQSPRLRRAVEGLTGRSRIERLF